MGQFNNVSDIHHTVEDIMNKFMGQLHEIIAHNFENVLNCIDVYSSEELVEIARMLILITNFQRKISFDEESVDNNIAVLSITKYGGFSWVCT